MTSKAQESQKNKIDLAERLWSAGTMWKSIWPVITHRVVLLAVAFIGAKFVFAHEVADKLMKGDTVQLWTGAPKISLSEIESYLSLVAVPAIISAWLAAWQRIKAKFALIRARMSPEPLTNHEVKEIVAEASPKEIVATVLAKP